MDVAKLKLGDLAVDAKNFDLRVAYWKIRKGKSKLPGHEHPGIIEMWADVDVLVMQYDCTQKELLGTAKVDQKGRFLVSQRLTFSGVDASGAHTKTATENLFSSYVAASGYGDSLTFDSKLNERFGSYAQPVPYAKFLKAFGDKTSFDIFANVKYVLLRIEPSVPMPKGSAFLAIPYDILFHAEPTFNCRNGMEIDRHTGLGEFSRHFALDPSDPDLREILRKRLVKDRKALAKNLKEAKENTAKAKAQAKNEPDSKLYKAFYEIDKRYSDSLSKQLKALDKRLKGYGID